MHQTQGATIHRYVTNGCKCGNPERAAHNASVIAMSAQQARGAKKAGDEWLSANPGACKDIPQSMESFQPQLVIYSFASSGPAIKYELDTGVPSLAVLFHRGVGVKTHGYGKRGTQICASALLMLECKSQLPCLGIVLFGSWS